MVLVVEVVMEVKVEVDVRVELGLKVKVEIKLEVGLEYLYFSVLSPGHHHLTVMTHRQAEHRLIHHHEIILSLVL